LAGARDQERAAGGTDQAQLAQQATLTHEQAQAAALAKLHGTVERTRLERDNNTVVYEVTVSPQRGGVSQDVEIDAATGSVLKTQAPGQDEEEGNDD